MACCLKELKDGVGSKLYMEEGGNGTIRVNNVKGLTLMKGLIM